MPPYLYHKSGKAAVNILSETQFLQDLGFPARSSALSQQFLPEMFVVAAGAHGERHWHTPAEQQDFLLCLQACQHAAQRLSPGQPGEPASLGDLPLIVLSAGAIYDAVPESIITSMGGPDVLAQVIQVHDELQQELVGLSTQGKLVIAQKSGHEIHWSQPDLVIDAIREIVEKVRDQQ